MKKLIFLLSMCLWLVSNNAIAQNLSKEECLKYILDLRNEISVNHSDPCWVFSNFRLEYDLLKFDCHNTTTNKDEIFVFKLSEPIQIIPKTNNGKDELAIYNSSGVVLVVINNTIPGQKDRLERMLKAVNYLCKFKTADPFGS